MPRRGRLPLSPPTTFPQPTRSAPAPDEPETESLVTRRAIYRRGRFAPSRTGALRLPLYSRGSPTRSRAMRCSAPVAGAVKDTAPTVLDALGGGILDLLADAVSPGAW